MDPNIDLQLFGGRPPITARADSSATLQAALEAMPGGGADLDDDIVVPDANAAPTGAGASDEPVYSDEDDEGGQPAAAAPAAGGGQPTAPARPAAAAAPVVPPAAAAPAAAPGAAAAIVGAPDPWAEVVDVTYTDDDTGETYVVRAPKTYADKVNNGYVRRSMLNRETNWLRQHRGWVEPLIQNRQLPQLVPFIEAASKNQAFAQKVNQIFQRMQLGQSLDDPMTAAPPVAGSAAAAALAPGGAPAGGIDPRSMLAAIDQRTDIDEYTRSAFRALAEPFVGMVEGVNARITNYETTQQTQQREQAEAQRAAQQNAATERELGRSMRMALQTYFPSEFNDRTNADEYLRVLRFADSSGLFTSYGRSPGTVVLAYQQLRSPTGGVASPGAATVADIRREAEGRAALAADSVAANVAPAGPSGAAPAASGAPRVDKVPRFIVDKRTQKKRPLTAMEVSKYMEKHPNATV